METNKNGADGGGWKFNELPRSEFYEALGEMLEEFSELVLEDAEGSRKLDHYPYNDYFFGGFGGGEDAFYIGLWPAELQTVELYENGDIPLAEYRAECWPLLKCQEAQVHIGDADALVELAEDEEAVHKFADDLAELAGIVLVEDWD